MTAADAGRPTTKRGAGTLAVPGPAAYLWGKREPRSEISARSLALTIEPRTPPADVETMMCAARYLRIAVFAPILFIGLLSIDGAKQPRR